MKLSTLFILVAAVMLLSLASFGQTATGNLSVSANVQPACSVNAGGTMAFGTYDPLSGTDHDATGQINLTCTFGADAAIKLDQGGHDGGGSLAAPDRRMLGNTADFLDYQLFSDSSRVTEWEGSTGVPYTGDGTAEDVTVYGRIPAGQLVPQGNYTDSVTITVTY